MCGVQTGDLVVLRGLVNRPFLNGRIAMILGPAPVSHLFASSAPSAVAHGAASGAVQLLKVRVSGFEGGGVFAVSLANLRLPLAWCHDCRKVVRYRKGLRDVETLPVCTQCGHEFLEELPDHTAYREAKEFARLSQPPPAPAAEVSEALFGPVTYAAARTHGPLSQHDPLAGLSSFRTMAFSPNNYLPRTRPRPPPDNTE